MKKDYEKASMARTFRFTPTEWNMLEQEYKRLNMSMQFCGRYAMIAMLGQMKPLLPKYDDFVSEGHLKSEGEQFSKNGFCRELA